MMNPRPTRSRRAWAVVAAATLALGTSAGLASALTSAPQGLLSDPGGARRRDGDNAEALSAAIDDRQAHNVILLIGDGMGDSEITVARNYAEGAAGHFSGIDELPLTGQYTTYSLDRATGLPDYVPDSAATGSAWATGTKTYDNAISVGLDGTAQPTLLELAKAEGLKTGDVSTAEIQDATPAVQVAHISARSCYGPVRTSTTCPEAALENGGPGSITEQLLDTRPDVTLGGGAATFAETATAGDYAGMTLAEQAEARGYEVVTDRSQLQGTTSADQDQPLLGLFADGNLPVRYVGPAATAGGSQLPAQRCTDNPDRPASQPTLSDMTSKAIDLLDNPDGFFLQVEGASIDKQDHGANACGQIGETVDLDEAVQVALAYAEEEGNTSVFVTADHAHTSQIIEVGSTSPGISVTLETADGAPMAVNYGTSPAGGSQQHTGAQLRIAGYGPKAADVVGLTDQTDLFYTISSALGLGDQQTGPTSDDAVVVARPAQPRAGARVRLAVRKFDGDDTVGLTVSGPGVTRTRDLDVTEGRASTTVRLRQAGRWRVVARGAQSGATATDVVQVRRRR